MAKTKTPKKASLVEVITFLAPVQLHRAGADEPEVVNLNFKYVAPEDLVKRLDELGPMTPAGAVLDMATGWDMDEPFEKEHVEKLCRVYYGVGQAAIDGLIQGLAPARVGNFGQ